MNPITWIVIAVVGVPAALYLVWKLMEALHYRRLQREYERQRERGALSICKWGVDSEGNLFHVRVKYSPPPDARPPTVDDIPAFLRSRPADK